MATKKTNSGNPLLERLRANSVVKQTAVLSESEFFNKKDSTPTPVPILNLALSGRIDGGLTSGLTVLAGPSKHFKTNMALVMVASFLKQHADGVCILYDTEFGITPAYLDSMGVDATRVIHTPVDNIETLKFDMVKQLEAIERGDKVIVMIDSVGNIASKKELEDAKDEKAVADMSRAKALKSLFRITTPYLTTKNIPCVAINHVYMEQGMFPKAIVSGGTGIYYSADTIFIIGRRQNKDQKSGTIEGYDFILNVEKSRYVKEKSSLPIQVTWEGGINRWSGLLELALELGYITKPSPGWYSNDDGETKKREADTENPEFWIPVFKKGLDKALHEKFAVGAVRANIDPETGEITDETP